MGKKIQRKIPGFSLIEAAFVLLIAGIVASLTLPLLSTSRQLERHKITETNQMQLFQALAGYVLKYNQLPLPSRPELEGEKGLKCHGRTTSACVGIIPYQELGLPESVARDGHGNWFTYVVESVLTSQMDGINKLPEIFGVKQSSLQGPNGGWNYFCQIPVKGNIKLDSLKNTPIFQPTENDYIAVILISHGPKGTGAFHRTKDERLPVEHEAEKKNADANLEFKASIGSDKTSDFTHQVYWVTRNNLMAIYAQTPCQAKPGNSAQTPDYRGNPRVSATTTAYPEVPRGPFYLPGENQNGAPTSPRAPDPHANQGVPSNTSNELSLTQGESQSEAATSNRSRPTITATPHIPQERSLFN
ncbi:type II secretion system protein [Candidatus Paracaedibacter symbiosus]|uniref:type II secretion system protein n=1 Tax=Candidatus Paracaedibacter symbiosus TaxID=244582 RepID=UPI0005094A1A|nr:type II secretion system protein [Candidatus Paracaedibacter symbiosus]